ncbi:MAG TPA: hypothetical protein VIJ68_04820 [Candidatus Saccharimonadales bacterium]
MIELNLLPDVKLEYIKSQRTRRLVLSISVLVSIVAVAILILLLGIDGLQRKHLSDLNHNISTDSTTLKGEPHINQILTVQNQLESLTALQDGKPATSRLFDYLDQVTPAAADINNFTIDFTLQTATITGDADSLSTINQYVDTLKSTTYTTSSNTTAAKAFNNVVLSAFSLNNATAQNGKPAEYTIALGYDKNIFDIAQDNVKLSIGTQVTNRTQVSQPSDLFTTAPATPSGGSH